MGNWTRSNAEICLIATKGKGLKRLSASVHSVLDDRIMHHSKKPDHVRDKIVSLVGNVPRIELFARNLSDGWDVWGNEV
jgi:N6-adenosine-specific RNA methylase IME4